MSRAKAEGPCQALTVRADTSSVHGSNAPPADRPILIGNLQTPEGSLINLTSLGRPLPGDAFSWLPPRTLILSPPRCRCGATESARRSPPFGGAVHPTI